MMEKGNHRGNSMFFLSLWERKIEGEGNKNKEENKWIS
jgi:hypothetical protein